MTKHEQAYIPGMCNINQAEVAYRKKAMYVGLGLTIVLLVAMIVFGVNIFIRSAVLFIPLYIAIIGYLQMKNKFCVSYGASGKQNATDGNDKASTVADKKAIAADKKKAREMNTQALISTLVILAVLLLVPSAY
jgi:predicted tellurium resistance membrane protein TerC